MNKAGFKLAAIQTREDANCVRLGLKGPFTDAQVCLTLDSSGSVQKFKRLTTETQTQKCRTTPGFGFAGAVEVSAAAVDENVAMVGDIFGPDLDEAIITIRSHTHSCVG